MLTGRMVAAEKGYFGQIFLDGHLIWTGSVGSKRDAAIEAAVMLQTLRDLARRKP